MGNSSSVWTSFLHTLTLVSMGCATRCMDHQIFFLFTYWKASVHSVHTRQCAKPQIRKSISWLDDVDTVNASAIKWILMQFTTFQVVSWLIRTAHMAAIFSHAVNTLDKKYTVTARKITGLSFAPFCKLCILSCICSNDVASWFQPWQQIFLNSCLIGTQQLKRFFKASTYRAAF